MRAMPELTSELCDRCGLCVIACHGDGIIVLEDSAVAIRPTENCDYCGVCEAVCPTGAISCPYDVIYDRTN